MVRFIFISFFSLISLATFSKNIAGIPESTYKDPKACIDYCKKELELYDRNGERDSSYFNLLIEMSICTAMSGKYKEADSVLVNVVLSEKEVLTDLQLCVVHKALSRVKELLGEYTSSVWHANESILYAHKLQSKKFLGDAFLNRGNGLVAQSDLSGAITSYYRAYTFYQSVNDSTGMGMAIGNVSTIYSKLGDFEKFYELLLVEQELLPVNANNGADILNQGNRIYALIELGQRGAHIEEQIYSVIRKAEQRNMDGILSWLLNLAGYYFQKVDKFIEAKEIYSKAIVLAERSGAALEIMRIRGSIASNYLNLGYSDSCKIFMNETLDLARQLGDTAEFIKVLRVISGNYRLMGDYQSAYNYLWECDSLSSLFRSSERLKMLSELETKYSNERLKRENEESRNTVLLHQRAQVVGLAVFLFVIIVFLFNRNRQLKRNRDLSNEVDRITMELSKREGYSSPFTIDNIKSKLSGASSLNIQDFELILLLIESKGALTNGDMAQRLGWSLDTLRYHKKKINQSFSLPKGTNEDIIAKVLEIVSK